MCFYKCSKCLDGTEVLFCGTCAGDINSEKVLDTYDDLDGIDGIKSDVLTEKL